MNTQEIQELDKDIKDFVISITYGGYGNQLDDTMPLEFCEKMLKSFISQKLKEQEERHKMYIDEIKENNQTDKDWSVWEAGSKLQ